MESKTRFEANRTDPISVPLAGVSSVSCSVDQGTITLVTDPAATALTGTASIVLKASSKERAENYLKEVTLNINVTDLHQARVAARFPPVWAKQNFANRPGSLRIDYRLTGPPTLAYEFRSNNGDVVVEGNTTKLTVNAVNGNIDAGSRVDQEVRLETRNGHITGVLGNIQGVYLNAEKGNIDVSHVGDQPYTDHYTAISSTGSIEVDLPLVTKGSAHLRTGQGSIDVSIPVGSSVDLEANTASGEVEVVGQLTTQEAQTAPGSLVGTIGEPVGKVELVASNGDVTIRIQ